MSQVLASVAALAVLVSASSAQTDDPKPPDETIEYISFEGQVRQLYPWIGKHVVFLTRSNELEPATMVQLVEVFDGIWEFYVEATGRRPRKAKEHAGKATIAEEPETCGAACGYLGYTGIEVMPPYFANLYETFRDSGEIDQALPYEFGRNFWFYGDQLEYHDAQNTGSITTGYAVLMRFWALEAVERSIGPFNGAPGVVFTETIHGLVDEYESSKKNSWKSTLSKGRGVDNRLNLGATDLFASMLMHLRSISERDDFATRVWRFAGEQPDARDTEAAVTNLIVAASLAAELDLTDVFKGWRFPVSRDARKRVKEGLADGARLSSDGSDPVPVSGTGSYVFQAGTESAEKPVRIWYHVPDRLKHKTKVLFVLHDEWRRGERLRDRWLTIAKNKRIVLLVPEFSELHYAGSDGYELGNRLDADGNPTPEDQWIFTTIDDIFVHASQSLALGAEAYSMYGCGVAAQLVHRFVLFKPDRIDVAVAANAEWYTLPESDREWPYGLAGEELSAERLGRAFEAGLIVALGKQATASLTDSPAEARGQGPHILARGKSFFDLARKRAKAEGARFRWKLELVPGVDDSSYRMRMRASGLLGL